MSEASSGPDGYFRIPSDGPWAIFDRLFDAVIIVDRAARLYYANESFRTLSDVRPSAIESHESARDYIELPEECWGPLVDAGGDDPSARYREVGFITASGRLGRAQIYTGAIDAASTDRDDGQKDLLCLVIRDVSIEDRLHAKYKFQVDANDQLRAEGTRVILEARFLREVMTDLGPYRDEGEMFDVVAARLKTEIGCREVHFFQINEETGGVEATGLGARPDSVQADIISQLEPILKDFRGETVRSAVLRPQGQAWVTFCRPRLARTVVMVACPRMASKPHELRPFFEALSGQLNACLDSRAFFFDPQIDVATALHGRRFFDSRLQIECQRSAAKHVALSLMLIEVDASSSVDLAETFKTVGHALRRRLRTADFVARVDGSRFGLLLPETSSEEALLLAESLRQVMGRGVPDLVPPTMTCGITQFNWTSDHADSLFANAEDALLRAKVAPAARAA